MALQPHQSLVGLFTLFSTCWTSSFIVLKRSHPFVPTLYLTATLLSITLCQPTKTWWFWGKVEQLHSNSTVCSGCSLSHQALVQLHTQLKIYNQKRQPLIPASTPAWALCSHCKTDSKGSKSQKNLKRSIQASQQKPPHILAINFFLLFYCFKILLILHTKEFTCPGPARILTDKLLLPEEVQHGCCLPEISDPKPEGYKLNRHLLSQHIPLPLRSSDTQPMFTLQPFPKESRVF